MEIIEGKGISNVSWGTVDRALNNRGRIKPEVAENIKSHAVCSGGNPQGRRRGGQPWRNCDSEKNSSSQRKGHHRSHGIYERTGGLRCSFSSGKGRKNQYHKLILLKQNSYLFQINLCYFSIINKYIESEEHRMSKLLKAVIIFSGIGITALGIRTYLKKDLNFNNYFQTIFKSNPNERRV